MNFRVFPNTPPVAPTSIPLGFSLEYSQDPASLIWTGDGFVAAITYEVAPNSSNLLDKRVMIVSFDVAGLIREMFDLDTEPAMLPKLSLVAGRVAVTWVRPGRARGGPMTQGFLRFLHCGP